MLPSLLPSMLPSLLLLVTTTSATVWQRNLDLVKGVSRTQRVEAGTAVEVECELGELPEAAELAWVRLERGWETLLSYWSPGEGVEDLTRGAAGAREGNSWTLTMHRVNTSYAGFYQCQVVLGDEAVSTRKVHLSVLDPTKVEHQNRYVIEKAGGNVTLDCTDFTGEEEPAWRKEGAGPLLEGRGNTLKLIKVDREDSGVYVCSVSGQPALNISLRVDHPPSINTSRPVYQAPGYPASLHCSVAAVPVPAVSWHRGGEAITSTGDYSISISSYRDGWQEVTLFLPSVSREQYGRYTCRAANTQGQASSSVELRHSSTPVLPRSSSPSHPPTLILLPLLLYLAH